MGIILFQGVGALEGLGPVRDETRMALQGFPNPGPNGAESRQPDSDCVTAHAAQANSLATPRRAEARDHPAPFLVCFLESFFFGIGNEGSGSSPDAKTQGVEGDNLVF